MAELLDWVEKAAVENLKLHHHSADVLARESVTTLTVLLAGVAGGIAYAARLVEKANWEWISVGAASLTVYLALLSFLLVWRCLRIEPLPAIHNEPRNLYRKELALTEIREYELENMQLAIDEAAARNARVAGWLNRVRLAAVISPAVFVGAAVIWWAMTACGAESAPYLLCTHRAEPAAAAE